MLTLPPDPLSISPISPISPTLLSRPQGVYVGEPNHQWARSPGQQMCQDSAGAVRRSHGARGRERHLHEWWVDPPVTKQSLTWRNLNTETC